MTEQHRLECMSDGERADYLRACALYESVLEDNISRLISELTEKDRLAFRDQGQKNDDEIRAFFKSVNHLDGAQDRTKSVLFKRLLEGHAPLPIAPPVSWGYPWYDAIESQGPWPVSISRRVESVDEFTCQSLDFNTAQRFDGLQINQSVWTLLERRGDTCALVSYKRWFSLGYTWLLQRHRVKASDSASAIVAANNPRFTGRVITLSDLRLVERGKAEMQFDKLKWGKDSAAAASYITTQRRISMLCERAATAEVREGQSLLLQRREQGLPDTPGRDEVEAQAVEGVQRVLRDGYFVEEDGVLYTYEWLLTAHTRGQAQNRTAE